MNWDFYVDDTENNESIRLGFKNSDSETITDVSIMAQSDLDVIKSNAATALANAESALSTAESADSKVDSAKTTADSAYTLAKTNSTSITSLSNTKANLSDVTTRFTTIESSLTTLQNYFNNIILIEPIRYALSGGSVVDFRTVNIAGTYVKLNGSFKASYTDGDYVGDLTFKQDSSNQVRWYRENFYDGTHGKSVQVSINSFTNNSSSSTYTVKPRSWIVHVY